MNSESPVQLEPVRQACSAQQENCLDLDAIVFVHGIYGGTDTFRNESTGFDWPSQFPAMVAGRKVDVFRLFYRDKLLAWAKESNPRFLDVARAVLEAMKPLRKRRYRSIGFIAHSLGGNVVSTYIHMVKAQLGHPQRSQHAFVITLATPVLGAQIANIAGDLKRSLGMSDALLDSLKSGNLYLTMLNEFRMLEEVRQARYVCREVHLHAAYELRDMHLVKVVPAVTAVAPIVNLVNSPIKGFPLDHSHIAKPRSSTDDVFIWVMQRVEDEYTRLRAWGESHKPDALCEKIDFVPEG